MWRQIHLIHGSLGPRESASQNGVSIGSAVLHCTAHWYAQHTHRRTTNRAKCVAIGRMIHVIHAMRLKICHCIIKLLLLSAVTTISRVLYRAVPQRIYTVFLHNTCFPMDLFTANSLSTNRPSFAAANRPVTLTRVTNERVVRLGIGLTGSTRCRSVQLMCCEH